MRIKILGFTILAFSFAQIQYRLLSHCISMNIFNLNWLNALCFILAEIQLYSISNSLKRFLLFDDMIRNVKDNGLYEIYKKLFVPL